MQDVSTAQGHYGVNANFAGNISPSTFWRLNLLTIAKYASRSSCRSEESRRVTRDPKTEKESGTQGEMCTHLANEYVLCVSVTKEGERIFFSSWGLIFWKLRDILEANARSAVPIGKQLSNLLRAQRREEEIVPLCLPQNCLFLRSFPDCIVRVNAGARSHPIVDAREASWNMYLDGVFALKIAVSNEWALLLSWRHSEL